MNRINQLFQIKKKNILSVFYTAGFPALHDTLTIAKGLQDAGADMLEIGFPFSDPLADGPVIQRSSEIALDNGMSLKVLFEQLKDLRKEITIPVLLMGYVNPVMQYGVERFCDACVEAGVDGVIIPDLPMYEYENLYQDIFESRKLSNIFLVTPQSSDERIQKIDALTNGFIYLLSSSSTTGSVLKQGDDSEKYFQHIKNMNLKNPTVIGFGISDRVSFQKACSNANGAIIGSAFVKAISEGDLSKIPVFIRSIL